MFKTIKTFFFFAYPQWKSNPWNAQQVGADCLGDPLTEWTAMPMYVALIIGSVNCTRFFFSPQIHSVFLDLMVHRLGYEGW